jgi:hypothetical protein
MRDDEIHDFTGFLFVYLNPLVKAIIIGGMMTFSSRGFFRVTSKIERSDRALSQSCFESPCPLPPRFNG